MTERVALSRAIKAGKIAMTKCHATAITSPSLREKRSFSWQSITTRQRKKAHCEVDCSLETSCYALVALSRTIKAGKIAMTKRHAASFEQSEVIYNNNACNVMLKKLDRILDCI